MKLKLAPNPIFAFLLVFLFSIALFVAANTGQTVDETFYNGSGYPIVRYNDYGFLGEHPPLMMQLGSLPLLVIQPEFPIKNPVFLEGQEGKDISETGSKFLYKMGNDPDQILLLERLPIILVTVLLGAFLFRWAKELYGVGGALLSLTLFVFSPDILAHGSLFTTDLGLAAFFFIGLYYFRRLIGDPSSKRVVLAGLFLGLALLTKISAVLLLPITAVMLIPFLLKSDKRWEKEDIRAMTLCLGIYVFALILRQKLFMVFLGPMVLLSLQFISTKDSYLRRNDKASTFTPISSFLVLMGWGICFYLSAQLSAPAIVRTLIVSGQIVMALMSFFLFSKPPFQSRVAVFQVFATVWFLAIAILALGYTEIWTIFFKQSPFYHYVRSFQIALAHTQSDHRICAEGSWLVCDWRYFLTLLTVKMPLASLVLIATGLIGFLRLKVRLIEKWQIIVPTVLFLFVASFVNKLNIGIRHILPVYPFLFLIAGASWPWLCNIQKPTLKKISISILGSLLLFSSLRILTFLPHPLTYFNVLVGGPEDGAKLVADSNLDWGQDNKHLAIWAQKEKILIHLALVAFNRDIFDYYQVPWTLMKKDDFENPKSGYYALSLSIYQQEQKKENSWFRSQKPLTQIGNTIVVFKV